MGVFDPPIDWGNPKDTFPYEGLNNDTNERVTIETPEQAWDIILGWDCSDDMRYLNAIESLASPKTLFDFESQEVIKMYMYCKEMSTPPFPGPHGAQPAWWLEAYQVIAHNYGVASAAKSKKDEHNRKTQQVME